MPCLSQYCIMFLMILINSIVFAQETLHDKVMHMHHHEKSQLKQRAFEFLSTWNTSADLIKPAKHELDHKIKENKHKGKDSKNGTEKLQKTYDDMVYADGIERSFIAETFSLPMVHELKTKGVELEASDIYTAQYVIKFTLGVPRFNHGELDENNLDQMEQELSSLINEFPENDAHNQEVNGHVIDVFRQEANAYFASFVAKNQAQLANSGGKSSGPVTGLSNMSCKEKYELLKKQGIMH